MIDMHDDPVKTAREIVIHARDLEVRRRGKVVLPGISFGVRRGLTTGLLGPSGSGKTTLLRAIVGVQVVAAGDVDVLGQPAGSPDLRRRIGYTTQSPSVYTDLTVHENLVYFSTIVGAPRERVDEVLATVDLEGKRDQQVGTLSGGERSRTSLAAALLGNPDVLVLDEPTVGLDPVLRRDLWNTFHALAREGVTIIVSTHVMDEAERCDDLMLMRDGRIVAQAPPAQILEETGCDTIEHAFIKLSEVPS